MPAAPEPFEIHVDDAVLDDLRARLDATRWPDEVDGAGWEMGSNLDYMKELAAYWRDGYDWREQERRLNALPQFKAEIDGLGIHFVHIEGKGPDPFPLIVSHGWPGSFFEMHKIAGPLTDPAAHGGDPADAFHLVVPSLIGYGFSDASREPGMTTHRMAELFGSLMIDTLGYDRFGAQGGDWGAAVTASLAEQYPANVAGIHLNLVIGRMARLAGESASPEVEAYRAEMARWVRDESAYSIMQGTRPQTLAYGLNDSPAGLAGWIVEKWRAWSDCERRRRALVHQGRAADERHDLLGDADHQLVGAALPGEPRRVRPRRAASRRPPPSRCSPKRYRTRRAALSSKATTSSPVDGDAPRRPLRRHGGARPPRRRRQRLLPHPALGALAPASPAGDPCTTCAAQRRIS